MKKFLRRIRFRVRWAFRPPPIIAGGSPVPNECIPYYEPGARLTGHCEAAVTGKRLVDISDPPQSGGPGGGLSTSTSGGNIVVSHAPAGGLAIGVASYDAAIAKKVSIIGPGAVVPVTAGGTITAGQEVEAAAGGKVIAQDTGRAIGRAFSSATLDTDCAVLIYAGASGAAF